MNGNWVKNCQNTEITSNAKKVKPVLLAGGNGEGLWPYLEKAIQSNLFL